MSEPGVQLAEAAAQLRAAVEDILLRLGVGPAGGTVTRDEALAAGPGAVRWEYNVRAGAAGSVDVAALAAAYRAAGWTVTDRSGPREQAVQLQRDGMALGVHHAAGTVVVGGATPDVPTR
ncbi:hypothetical protein Athai_11220 [Actinocatenispora thailandica]|uniref:Uncharacterized protein n=1 Tax=Actinocatenispora thailandica TaxID=227318 RepID=A0A7R7HW57_9ACTN|nr:hypothetical protein [Actinocatenispora thailandica]BCJ33619.1 hypothetical protein Athai_11220 [Actinocatenispora thailandica]